MAVGINVQGNHFFRNLEMSGNRPKVGNLCIQGNLIVAAAQKHLYINRTVNHYSYVMFTGNLDKCEFFSIYCLHFPPE